MLKKIFTALSVSALCAIGAFAQDYTYERVDYIYYDGPDATTPAKGAYYDTGALPFYNSRISVQFSVDQKSNDNNELCAVFSARTTAESGASLFINTSSNSFHYTFDQEVAGSVGSYTVGEKQTAFLSSAGLEIDGENVYTRSSDDLDWELSNTDENKIYLFRDREYHQFYGRIYNFTISGSQYFEYLPFKRSDGKAVFYNSFNDEYLEPKGEYASYFKCGYDEGTWMRPKYVACSGGDKNSHGDLTGEKILDGDGATYFSKWCTHLSDTAATYVIMNAEEKVVPTGYQFSNGGDTYEYQSRTPKAWILYGSNDDAAVGSNAKSIAREEGFSIDDYWTVVDQKSDQSMLKYNNIDCYYTDCNESDDAYKYYMLKITENCGTSAKDNIIQIADFKLFYNEYVEPASYTYERVDYIYYDGDEVSGDNMTNGSYYDIDYVPNNKTIINVQYMGYSKGNGKWRPVFSGRNKGKAECGMSLFINTTADYSCYHYGFGDEKYDYAGTYTADEVHSAVISGSGLDVDGANAYTRSTTTTDESLNGNTTSITLFLSTNESQFYGRIYSFVVYEVSGSSNTMICELLPYKRSDGKAVFYDSKSGKYYEPHGEGFKTGVDDGQWMRPGYVAGNGGYDNQTGDMMLDNLGAANASKWCQGFVKGTPAYVIMDAGKKVIPTGYKLYNAGDTYFTGGRTPSVWTLYGSNDEAAASGSADETIWTVVDEQSNSSLLNYNDVDFFNGECNSEGAAYRYYMLSVSAVQNGGTLQIGDFKLFYEDYTEPDPSDPTAIDKTTLSNETNDGIRYSLDGRRVSNNYRGIVIVNGKKMLVK